MVGEVDFTSESLFKLNLPKNSNLKGCNKIMFDYENQKVGNDAYLVEYGDCNFNIKQKNIVLGNGNLAIIKLLPSMTLKQSIKIIIKQNQNQIQIPFLLINSQDGDIIQNYMSRNPQE